MKPLTDGSACRRSHSGVAVMLIILIFLSMPLFTSLCFSADDQTSKAVRRTSSDQRRVALVIGNSDYKDMPLRNPAHDADDIANVLRGLGFTVQTKINADQRGMEEAVKEFVRKIQNGDVGLFYFSGHGVQVHGENYLMPVGGSITSEADVKYKAVSAGYILAQMDESRNRTNIFVLDACRNNPFKGFRSMSKGLTMMDAPVGTFIAYATAPGSVAADGTDRNSPYAKHLMQAMKSKGIKIEDVFKEVLREVRKETEGKQIPWIASSLQEDFSFNPSLASRTQEASFPMSPPSGGVSDPFSKYREKAEQLVVLLSASGDAATREELNRMYKDPEVVKWFRQAGVQGDPVAQMMLGRMFAAGLEVPKDEREAVKWYRKAADQGNAHAQYNLGRIYQNGYGVAKDYDEAVKWFKKAGEQGNASAQFSLGYMYENGFGVAKDSQEAVKWYRKAADQGNGGAQTRLGRKYRLGLGVAKDYGEAVKWHRKSAEQGNAAGQNGLGLMYQYGFGVAKECGEALKWYRKAVEQGNTDAQNNLGVMHKNGYGVPKDRKEAIKWYKKAAEKGNEYAKKELQKLGLAAK